MNRDDGNGLTVLAWAVYNGNADLVELLLASDHVDPHIKCEFYIPHSTEPSCLKFETESPLVRLSAVSLAFAMGNVEILKIFVKHTMITLYLYWPLSAQALLCHGIETSSVQMLEAVLESLPEDKVDSVLNEVDFDFWPQQEGLVFPGGRKSEVEFLYKQLKRQNYVSLLYGIMAKGNASILEVFFKFPGSNRFQVYGRLDALQMASGMGMLQIFKFLLAN